ncbi:hypothetical protein EVG20_g5526 [Dentipellis fragilis]|uniref:DNA recombination and repair protein Rad51-like C-terminal domain-containing protein n=1 Tax=Dentipellis fragilis TaxID=205917 RepID=A0A4Y9YTS4_9AGAM|nr:hypothetical protein EVG20_g5526 [Dentipellis fragilis]
MSNRLSAFSAHIPPDLLAQLLDLNIRTVADFILTPPIDLLTRLPRGSTSLGELTDCIESVAQEVAAAGVNGEEMYEAEMLRAAEMDGEDVRAGIAELDALVGGSFGGAVGGRVIEVSGDKGGGKTALALHIALNHLAHYERAAAIWLDTTGELSPGRITQAYPAHTGPAAGTALERLHISLAFDLDTVYNVLDSLRSVLQDMRRWWPSCRSLRELARSQSLCILVINTSTNANGSNPSSVFAETTRKPALGPSFTFLTDTTLWVAHPPPPSERDSDPFLEDPSEEDKSVVNPAEVRVVEVFRSSMSVSWPIIELILASCITDFEPPAAIPAADFHISKAAIILEVFPLVPPILHLTTRGHGGSSTARPI